MGLLLFMVVRNIYYFGNIMNNKFSQLTNKKVSWLFSYKLVNLYFSIEKKCVNTQKNIINLLIYIMK